MAIELKILWDGDVPGVAEHRVSLSAFGPALIQLLVAYRRIASNMMRNATSYAETGRLRDLANYLDIEIAAVEGNSSGFAGVVTYNQPPPPQTDLFFPHGIAERAGVELMEAIEQEGNGHLYNSGIRKYLASLPPGLTRQAYELNDNGRPLHAPVVLEHVELVDAVLDLPYLMAFSGRVVGVGFEPGRNEVRIRTEENETFRLLASAPLVERALELRGTTVAGLALRSKESRLLRLQTPSQPLFTLSPDLEEEYIFQRWDILLRRLAQ